MCASTRKRAALIKLTTPITNIVTARLPGDYSHLKNRLQKVDFLARKVHFSIEPSYLKKCPDILARAIFVIEATKLFEHVGFRACQEISKF